jgi:CMP-N-acetylneuraminic acid synthetase
MLGEVLGLIPARAGSSGVPGKNVRLLGGRPLIEWTIEAALASGLSRVVLSTDSPLYAEIGRAAGAEAPFLRPERLATAGATAIGVVQHALEYFRESEGWVPSAVLYLQPTSPFRTAADIDRGLELFAASTADSVVSFAATADHPSYVYWRDGDELRAVLPDEPRAERRQDMRPAVTPNNAIMGSRTPWFLRPGAGDGLIVNLASCVPYFVDGDAVLDIDTERDFALAEVIAAERLIPGIAALP